jgi:hypothetical protein
MAALSSVTAKVFVILGFVQIGGPGTQRLLRADQTRVQNLYQLSQQIQFSWRANGNSLPKDLSGLPNASLDPISRAPYVYNVVEGSKYELCATFSALSNQNNGTMKHGAWAHAGGTHCFPLDASMEVENPYIYLQD